MVKELAEEISQNLADVIGIDDMNDVKSTKDMVKKLMQNPKKFTDLFKTINDKLQSRLKSGEISQSELLQEVTEFMSKMKGNGEVGEFDFQEMFRNMGAGGGSDMMNILKGMFKPEPKVEKKNTDVADKKVSLKEKMRDRIMIKKLQQAEFELKEQNRINEASKN